MIQQDFGEKAYITLAIRQSEVDQQLLQMKARIAKVSLEEAQGLKNIAGLKMVYTYTR